MLRLAILVALLFTSFGASAAPACIPSIYGEQVGNLADRRDDDGRYGVFMCKLADGSVMPYAWACVHGTCHTVGGFAGIFDAMKQSADPRAAASAAWDANFGSKCETAAGKLALLCARAEKLMEEVYPLKPVVRIMEDQPPPPKYAVKANGTATTRPAYTLTAGVRGTKEVARATVKQPCKTSSPTLASTGTDLWAEFGPDYKPGVVAVCSKR